MVMDRRAALALLGAVLLAPPVARAAGGVPPEDLIGRPVPAGLAPRRIVLLDARDVVTMAILHPDPSALVVGWAGVDQFDSDSLRRQYDRGADGAPIPVVGGLSADSLSIEGILALAPDLVVATVRMDPDRGAGALGDRLSALGIPLVFANGASNDEGTVGDPIDDMARALRLWGALLGAEARAEAYVAFVEEHLAEVARRIGAAPPIPAYLELQSTYDDCCWAAGRRIWGDLLTRAGGQTLAAVDAPWYAKVSLEQLLTEAPAVYVASGGAFGAGTRPAIGPGLDPEAGRAGLRRLTERPGLGGLPAVRDGRVHGVWTGLLTIPPLSVLFVEVVAQWLRPDLFADLDPTRTLAEINHRFLAHPLAGPCWLSAE
jgi:iron complex transport system substrate-binding protein